MFSITGVAASMYASKSASFPVTADTDQPNDARASANVIRPSVIVTINHPLFFINNHGRANLHHGGPHRFQRLL
jgi:hypothetical protein